MKYFFGFLFLAWIGPCFAFAQGNEDLEKTVRQDYETHAQEQRIDTKFYDLLLDEEVEEAEPEIAESEQNDLQTGSGFGRFISLIMSIALIVGVVILLVQNAGALNADRQENRRWAREEQKKQPPTLIPQEVKKRSDIYTNRADKVRAVEDMLAEVFGKIERELDLVFGESETARELERRLNGLWRHHQFLQQLVQASEMSQFAGVPPSAEQYQGCVYAYKKIMLGAAGEKVK